MARAISILGVIAESERGLRAMEIASELGLGRQATYHLLHTLTGCGMVTRDPQNRYVLGLQVATLASAFMRHLAPPEHLAPLVRDVAAQTGETAYAVGWLDGEIVILVSAPGSNAIQAMAVPQGYYKHAHARASGKLLLAYATAEARESYLATHALERRTANTLTDRSALEQELMRIRAEGFSVDREEFALGLSCLAVPVGRSNATYAIGISAPIERFKDMFADYLRIMQQAVVTAR